MTHRRSTRHALDRTAALCTIGLIALLPIPGRADPLTAPAASDAARHGPRALVTPKPVLPLSPEPDAVSRAGAGPSPFSAKAVSPAATTPGQTLTAPVTVNASTSADALTVTQSGAGRAISGAVTSSSNGLSAVKGITAGTGSGVNGVNSGTTGPAGKFEITNAASLQSGVLATTTGHGSGIQAIVKSTDHFDTAAVYGEHDATDLWGIGVEGDGGIIGVFGYSASGDGVAGRSGSGGAGVSGESEGLGAGSWGVHGYSAHYAGVYGESGVAIGVYGVSDTGKGVVGVSNTGYAGYFEGQLRTTSTMTAQSYAVLSDRNAKQSFKGIDGAVVLDRIAALPIAEWDYKDKPGIHHIGPMAQDFHAAFGLGADDTHIDLVDSVGVSLAAIKALQRQLQDRDGRIDALVAQVQALQRSVDAQMASQGPDLTTTASLRP